MKRWTRLVTAAVVATGMIGGWMAYAEARAELSGYDCGSDGENYRIGRRIGADELLEYEASASEGEYYAEACQRLDDAQDGLVRLIDDYYGEPLGRFKLTAYTAGFESCGKRPNDPLYGITATGTKVREYHTIASDWDVLPPGTKVRIEGFPYIYTVEDCGGAVRGNHIDIYMEDLDEALEWGVREREVWLIQE